MRKTTVTICACSSRSFIDKDMVAGVAAVFRQEGFDVNIEADLCQRAMALSDGIAGITSGAILACHSRVIRSHLHRLGLECAQTVTMRGVTKEELLSQFGISNPVIRDTACFQAIQGEIKNLPVAQGCDAWYPVLDKTKCTECGKCHDFCLFGVFNMENKKVKVTHPQNCKNNCPACARICPDNALLFPKYEKSPINGGADIEEPYHPEEMDRMYRERLRMRLQQRRAGVSLFKKNEG